MRKMNTKAFTVVELIITFSIVMTISIGLFKIVDSYREKQQQESIKKQINGYVNEVVKVIKDDILKIGVKEMKGIDTKVTGDCSGYTQGIEIVFKDTSIKSLCVGNTSIKYNNIEYSFPSKFVSFKDDIILETITDTIHKPIYNQIIKDLADDTKITVPIIKKETHYTINIKLKHSEVDEEFNITLSTSSRDLEYSEKELSDDITSDYIKQIEYSEGMTSINLENKYIDKFIVLYNGSKENLNDITNKIKIENSVVNTIEMTLKSNAILQTYLKNNKVNEVVVPHSQASCSDVKLGVENPTCSITLQTGEGSGGIPLFNFNNLNKFIVNDFEDITEKDGVKVPYVFYNIKFSYNGYIKALDLRNENRSYQNNIFIPYNGIQIGNMYVSNLKYDTFSGDESFDEILGDKAIHALLAGYLYDKPGGGTRNFQEILTQATIHKNKDKTELNKINNLVISPYSEGELTNLPTALTNKVTNLVLSDKVTSISYALKVSELEAFGIKTIKYKSDSLDGISLSGFSCNNVLNKCTYTG